MKHVGDRICLDLLSCSGQNKFQHLRTSIEAKSGSKCQVVNFQSEASLASVTPKDFRESVDVGVICIGLMLRFDVGNSSCIIFCWWSGYCMIL